MNPQPDTPQVSLSARAASTQPNAAPAVLPGPTVGPQPNTATAPLPAREHGPRSARLGDFTLDASVLPITGLALVVGAAGAGAAYCLLRLIDLITNLSFYGRF